jgi:hypothetical protein
VDDSGKERVYPAALKLERMRTLFHEWAKEVVIATEPETWATSGWDRWEQQYPDGVVLSRHRRSTHDGYLAQLFETDGGWGLEISAPVVANKPRRSGVATARGHVRSCGAQTRPGASLDEAKAAIYWLIEQERERDLLKKREK